MAILTQEEMAQLSHRYRQEGKVVVFTNGCFDILHPGHIQLLELAKKEGDFLFVGVNGDDSVRRLKGQMRPLQSEEDRAVVINALKPVDDVTIFHEDTPEQLIGTIKPTVLVKGGEYPLDEIVGAREVLSFGGRVVRIPMVKNKSTTFILNSVIAR